MSEPVAVGQFWRSVRNGRVYRVEALVNGCARLRCLSCGEVKTVACGTPRTVNSHRRVPGDSPAAGKEPKP